MPKITFEFDSDELNTQTVKVASGTLLSEAAHLAGISINLECGGSGTCGKCKVLLDNKSILSCEKPVGTEDLVVKVPKTSLTSSFEVASTSHSISSFTSMYHHQPLLERYILTLPPAQMDDGISDFHRFKKELANALPEEELDIPLSLIQKLPNEIRRNRGTLQVFLSRVLEESVKVIDIEASDSIGKSFGLAIDLGTTTIAMALLDLETGNVLGHKTIYNRQKDCGADIISRINYAKNAERIDELKQLAIQGINQTARSLIDEAELSPEQIKIAHISGNTVMTHLLLGIVPEYIRLDPYTPALLDVPAFRAKELDLAIHPEGVVLFSPHVGSYVGGDITAGILATEINQTKDQVSLFMDVGTNGELVIGNQDFLMTCACSAGPAFEGGGIEHGMRAMKGAISDVSLDIPNEQFHLKVIGGGKAEGICGSAMIDLIAELFKKGLIDARGKFNRETCPALFLSSEGKIYLKLINRITISENDIANIIRAKAAIFSATLLLLNHLELDFSHVENFYIAGGFGENLNLKNAIAIGLFPNLPYEKFTYLGNTSLKGSMDLLLSKEAYQIQQASRLRMTYLNLNHEPGYMDQYTAALFLPHTDEKLFSKIDD